ncbi:hypothetical protein ACFLZZ_03485 [Nanoarchaeota archaeon]
MCFTPEISFTTFAVEMVLAFWVFHRNPKKTLNLIGAAILFLLGAYQFTELMICTSGNPLFWGMMAHLTYTFLPALAIHWSYALKGAKKSNLHVIYLLPTIFVLVSLFSTNFVKSAECTKYFVTIMYEWLPIWFYGYGLYYGIFIIISMVILLEALVKEKNEYKRKIYVWGIGGMLSFTMPVYGLVLFFPALSISFPSVLCEFALLSGIFILYILHLNEKKH